MPSLGADMDEGKLLEWKVRPGQVVRRGDVIAVVDTAKAAIDVESWHDGTVARLLVDPQTRVAVGTPILLLEGAAPAVRDAAAPAPPPLARDRRHISPAARRLAAEHGIDISTVKTAHDDAIHLEDVERAAHAGPSELSRTTATAHDVEPASRPSERTTAMRRVIAAAMSRSKREIPHYYLSEEVPLDAAMAWLEAANASRPVADRILLSSLLLAATARSLRDAREFNGFWLDGAFQPASGIHVGFAISLRGGGLVAPAIHDADRLPVDTLNAAVLDLTRRARAGSLSRTELVDATITVTNLGDHGVDAVFGVIHPPQVALVGFGRPRDRACVREGHVRALPTVHMSLAADHRVTDGHRGGLLLASIGRLVQEPAAIIEPAEPVETAPAAPPVITAPPDRDAAMRIVVATLGGVAPDVDLEALDPRRPLRDQVDLDSADWLEFLVRLHAATGVAIPDAVARTFTTLDRVVDHLASR